MGQRLCVTLEALVSATSFHPRENIYTRIDLPGRLYWGSAGRRGGGGDYRSALDANWITWPETASSTVVLRDM